MPVELTLALNSLTLAFNLLVLMAACGGTATAVAAEALGMAQKQVLTRKIGQHVSAMTRLCFVYVLFFVAVAVGFIIWRVPSAAKPWLGNPAALLPAVGILLAAVLGGLVYAGTWKALKKARPVHLIIGIVSALAGLATLPALFQLSGLAVSLDAEQVGQLTPAAVLSSPLPMAALAVQVVLLCAATGGVLGMVYVLTRRNRDDYGRDYYARALRFLAVWSMVFLLASLAAHLVWAYSHQDVVATWFSDPFQGPAWASALGLGFVAAMGLIPVALNPLPMRDKATIILCALATLLSVAGLVFPVMSGMLSL